MRKLSLTLSAFFLFFTIAPLHADSVDDAIAMKFYPVALDEHWYATHAFGHAPNRIFSTLRVDLARSGNDQYLAVAYSNGTAGAFRVIEGATVETAVLTTETDDPLFGGDGVPVVEAVDVDNDGGAEIAVQFAHASWIYRWTNGTLALLGPTRATRFGPTSNLGTIAFADLNGDGKLEVLEVMPSLTATYNIFSLDGYGNLVRQLDSAIFVDRFERGDGAPVTETRTFRAAPGAYVLRVVNGDQLKQSIVTAGEVKLNGKTVAGPNDFKKGARTLTVPVILAEENTLAVELRSNPASVLSIGITGR